ETLSSGKVEISDRTLEDIRNFGKTAFEGALDKELIKTAKELDVRINELQNGYSLRNFIYRFLNGNFANEYEDAKKMSFQVRLEEMRNIARMNIAIFDILSIDKKAIAKVRNTIEEIRDSTNSNYLNESRLEALEDFLWIMSGELPESLPVIGSITA
ncbi:7907_t:CDS:1, partial [Scutellospora calospora]